MESIRKFVDDFHATEKKLHVLVNNAGMTLNFKDTKRQYTKDNLEVTMGTNHFGKFHFLSASADQMNMGIACTFSEDRLQNKGICLS